MALPTSVNSFITDSVTQNSVGTLASASAMAMGVIYQSIAHSTGILYQNAVQTQQNSSIIAQAATNQGVIQTYSAGAMASAAATNKVASSDNSDLLLALAVALAVSKR